MLYLRLILLCPLFNLVNCVYYTQAARGLQKSSPDLQRWLEGRILKMHIPVAWWAGQRGEIELAGVNLWP